MEKFKNIPQDLKKILKNSNIKSVSHGCSDAQVCLIETLSESPKCYLKRGLPGTLEREKSILVWLKDKLPVPKVLYYSKAERDYLLIEGIKGVDLVSALSYLSSENVVSLLAEGLRMFQGVDINGCPFNMRFAQKLEETKSLVERKLIKIEDFEPENLEKSLEEIYRQLLLGKPESEDLAFTHGDYCFPNIIINDGKISGFIDLERGGIADRYQDIAIAVRSIRHNLQSEKYVKLFLDACGCENANFSKINYYILLDELF